MQDLDPFQHLIELHADGHCTAYIIIASIQHVTDNDLIESLYIQTPDTQTSTTSLGLTQAVTALEQHRIIQQFD